MKKFYEDMTPHVSNNPRAAYLNYKDIDLGRNTEEGRTSYTEASAWGRRYFLHNFEKLAKVKARVDPENYFWNEQGNPSFCICCCRLNLTNNEYAKKYIA
ncbi:hypothetical protein ZIOFF_003016 [Zingiber officinale]|uniref:Berberine/berberine-like domain-containing protein n=1 Tax=Zingiber officinale TaxID=94328 RepID=A0A8J5I8N1_ZINOF|nr:hypothetical protein ZIOFF_003016 [Zingiber officinale]